MTGGFLLISPPLRGNALAALAKGMFYMDQYTPWSYILLAISVGGFAVLSMTSPKAQ